ncbi:MAG TPA: glutaredoxin domain-containing protein [Candidatus Nanoarchaeia archaeon]|nr:glutaredoxin domain-containing protein [Candidatus Nanoarchaeia archaeon]
MEVKIYTIPTCPWSAKAKDWLKKKKVPFQDCNVAESQNGQFRDELLDKSGQIAVPVIDFNGIIVLGFSEQRLEEALAKAHKK